ncbi:MAG: EAL domain-containing protein, partial [Anaerolineae bacterium]|nr:EAL domain-containing protein [Anaerolineae bacterium]
MSLESDLRQAVARGEFILHYQDKVLTHSMAISGAEALLRWQHPSKGILGPGSFIGLAEETGLIVQIGEWVIRQACEQIMRWLEAGLAAVPVAVNLSAKQFHATDLLRSIASVLTETSIDPSCLAFEITEST